MRLHPSAFRPFWLACGLLVLAAAVGEVTLRLNATPVPDGGSSEGSLLTMPCGVAYRQLRRLETLSSQDPDTGMPVAIAVNSDGLRGAEVAVPKPQGVYRVLCLGDETVLGPDVEEGHSLPARLQQLLQARSRLRIEVLNAGMPGECPLLAWLRLRHSLLGLDPDLIVLHVDMSDVEDDRRHRRQTRLDGSGLPIACPHQSLTLPGGPRPWWRDLKLVDLLLQGMSSFGKSASEPLPASESETATAWLSDNPPDWDLYVEQSLAPLDEIRRTADGIGAVLVVATCPQPWQVSGDASAGPGVRERLGVAPGLVLSSRQPFDAITDYTRARNILCCDASPHFREFPEPARLYFRNAPSLSRLGNELYARVLSDFIGNQLSASGDATAIPPIRISLGGEGP